MKMEWMKSENASVYNVGLIFRIVLGYYTLRRSEMVGNIVTTPNVSYHGAVYRAPLYVNCA